MLGVRRESITEAAGNLQRAGVIRYRRGHIAVLQRSGSESRACEWYGVVKKELDRLLSDVRYRQGVVASCYGCRAPTTDLKTKGEADSTDLTAPSF
jgi:hypothetical protein